jgi:glycosyltransferase involved in cell wall biosynthesis
VYNRADVLGGAVESVIAQTETDWELVIVDDGSSDGSAEAAARYASDARIKIHRQPNGGVSAARNAGVAMSSGEWICFLDADDEWLPEHLSVLKDMRRLVPGAGLYATCVRILAPLGKIYDTSDYFKSPAEAMAIDNFYALYAENSYANVTHIDTTCVRRDVFDETGGFTLGAAIGEDLDFLLRIAARNRLVFTSRTTAVYHRERSVATERGAYIADWCFFPHAEEILADPSVSKERKSSLRAVMRPFTLRRARHLLLQGRRAEARAVFKSVSPMRFDFDTIATALMVYLAPARLVRAVSEYRWKRKKY